MNSTLALNADFLRDLSVVAEDENLLAKAVKYIRKLAAKKEDPTLMSKDEFFAKLEKGEEEYRQGKTHSITSVEQLNRFLSSL